MTSKELEQLLDACFVAKKITETLPELPKGMKPRHIHVLHAAYEKAILGEECCVSDISRRFGITLPSVTKLVRELEEMKLMEKYCKPEDKRTTLVKLTELGQYHVKKYVIDLHKEWAGNLSQITGDQVQEVADIVTRLKDTMPGMEN